MARARRKTPRISPPKFIPELRGEEVLEAVAHAFDIDVERLKGMADPQLYGKPRQAAAWFLRHCCGLPVRRVQEVLERPNVAIATYALRHVPQLMRRDPDFRKRVELARRALQPKIAYAS